MTRGLAEMTRVAVAAGAEEATLTGLSGLGDLILTCGSEKSRNFRYGMALARGETLGADVTIEGLHTARQIAALGGLDTGPHRGRRRGAGRWSGHGRGKSPTRFSTAPSNRSDPHAPLAVQIRTRDLVLGPAGGKRRRRRGMVRRAQLSGAQLHARDGAGRPRVFLTIPRPSAPWSASWRSPRLAHPDTTTEDARWDCVDIRAVAPLPQPVTLDAIKAREDLAGMVLVKNSRLSVQPVTDAEWRIVCQMGGGVTGVGCAFRRTIVPNAGAPEGNTLRIATVKEIGGPRPPRDPLLQLFEIKQSP